MNIYIDIDQTICVTKNGDYAGATPIKENIEKANKLYDKGHYVVYWTARGSLTNICWRKLTEKQLDEWGVKRHELILKKPAYDLFICDKVLNARDWEKMDDLP